jgi:7,8-dihydropterin-6-yl-methyl-4-(beta-D-ribofuranosyl)aminobenzene 5'-phosphate synthase
LRPSRLKMARTTTLAGDVFAANVDILRVDLSRIDAIVISHPHGDHTGGLAVALKARPGLPVYLPFGASSALAETLRSAGASVVVPEGPADVGHDALVTGAVGGPVPEQSLVITRPEGLVVVTGCSHPGMVSILERARQVAGGRLLAVLGGFHLLDHTDQAVAGIVVRFQELGVEKVGATHCTGEKAIEAFRKAYGARFIEMGAGRVVELPPHEGEGQGDRPFHLLLRTQSPPGGAARRGAAHLTPIVRFVEAR